jgi:hypothetical protein
MSFLRSPAAVAWLLAAAGACTIGDAWADDAQTGKLHPWVLIAMFWGVALASVSIHYLLPYLAQAAGWARRAWLQPAAARTRLAWVAWVYLARTPAWARRFWRQHAAASMRLAMRVRVHLALAAGALKRSTGRLAHGRIALASISALVGQGWDVARRTWEQQMAGARRAPGTLIGWSRSALKALRV